jgi:tetratricopeptide (TPR) repeat protein
VLGQHDASVDYLTVVVPNMRRVYGDEHPETVRAMVRLGFALERLGRADEAVEPLESTLDIAHRLYPEGGIDLVYHHLALSNCYRQLGWSDLAEEAATLYRTELIRWGSMSGADAKIPFDAALMLLHDPNPAHRDPEAALSLAERAVGLSGRSDPHILRTLALAQLQTGDPEAALETLEEGLERVPSDDPALRAAFEDDLAQLHASR